ncbi:unnamed protein product [Boreogadus saida]
MPVERTEPQGVEELYRHYEVYETIGSGREVKNWKCVQYGIDWEKKATSLDLGLVQGYLTGYVAILIGHRPVVFNSLKKKEVGEHKTQRSFGHAQMALFEEEYGWLRRLMDISNCLHKDSPPQA